MENQEQGDDALAKRKAELLTILEATLIVNNSNHTQNDVSKSLSNENKTFMPASTVKMDAVENGRTEDTEINSVKKYTPSKKLNEPVADENHSLSDSESARSDGCKINLDKNSVDIKLNFDTPLMVLNYEKEFSSSENTFTKGCKWSPDGSCLLVGCEDRKLRLFNLPNPVSCGDCQDEKWFLEDYQYYNKPALTVKEGEALFDYTWYPSMNSYAPDTCCFAVTCRDLPVHLFDAWNGSLICSYQAYNHLDQLVAAHSVSFNLDGSLLVCGFKKCLRVFNTCRPGREFDVIEAKEQPGILSCMAFNPMLPSIFVAGSYLGNLGLYSLDRNKLFCRIDGCPGGVTQVQFSADGTKLFSGARKSNDLLCWDVRNVGKLLWNFHREVKTQQRIHFDLEPRTNRYLISGTTSGTVLTWDINDLSIPNDDKPLKANHSSSFVAHKDCCNGVSLNPHYPVLATSSGQRHFPKLVSDSESGSDEDSRCLFTENRNKRENSVKLWWLR